MPRTVRITLTAAVLLVACAVLGSTVADREGVLGAVEVVLRSGVVFFGAFAAGGALSVLLGLLHRLPRRDRLSVQ